VAAADPHAELYGDRYYVYATNAGIYATSQAFCDAEDGEEHGFAAWSSTDLRNWKSEGRILNFHHFEWAKELGDAWAPCMAERNGRYYFYFCAKSRIGVAVGDSPTGPFEDAFGAPMVDFRDDMSAIDPMVFVDDDGQAYFYWGAIPGSWLEGRGFEIRDYLSVRKLDKDMVTFTSEEIPTITSPKGENGWHKLSHIEATHVFKRNGIYYLMWSPGSFQSDKDDESYRVHYATSESPLGPWKHADNNPVLFNQRDIGVIGPGHHSTIQLPGTDIWYCVYHCHKGDVDRKVFIDRMTFGEDGRIEQIIPTLEGPPVHPVVIALSASTKGPYPVGQTITLNVKFSEAFEGEVEKTELFSNGDKIGEIAGRGAEFGWTPEKVGFHRVSVRATLVSVKTYTSSALNMDVI
ncbi:MAG: hypothetical protein EOP06_03700, partial [Proteobacteria bacterium]